MARATTPIPRRLPTRGIPNPSLKQSANSKPPAPSTTASKLAQKSWKPDQPIRRAITATVREGDRWNHGGSGADVILDQSRPKQPLQSLTPGPTNASAHGLATPEESFDRHRVAPPATEFRSDRTPSARPSCDQNEQTSCRSANKPWRAQEAVGPMLAAMAAPSARHHNARPPPRPLAASQPLGSR